MPEDNTSKLVWFLAGTAIGATIALLYAPQRGTDTRKQILGRRTGQGRESLAESGRDMLDRGRDLYDKGRKIADEAAEMFDRGRKLVEGASKDKPWPEAADLNSLPAFRTSRWTDFSRPENRKAMQAALAKVRIAVRPGV